MAFLSGHRGRIIGVSGSLLVPAALVGALLVLVADFAGQFAFDTRYPVASSPASSGRPTSSI